MEYRVLGNFEVVRDGSPVDLGGLGAFFQGMVDWVDGTRTIEEVFADNDSEWAALDDAESDPGP